jgi:phosphatidylglycerophosphate synthase
MTDEPLQTREPPLRAWSRKHAVTMLAAVLACVYWHAAWPSALLGLPSFLSFMLASRGLLTPSGRFGLANAVTSLRLVLVLGLTVPGAWLSSRTVAAITIGVLCLDLLDGWLARSRGDASVFGARFDLETDALLVLVITLRLWLVEGYGAWVLTAGLLRYGYVILLWLAPGTGREEPRTLLGRYAFLTLMLGLIAGLAVRGPYGPLCVAIGTLTVSASFAHSIYFSHSAS